MTLGIGSRTAFGLTQNGFRTKDCPSLFHLDQVVVDVCPPKTAVCPVYYTAWQII